MKKTFIVYIAFASLLLCSCNEELFIESISVVEEKIKPEKVTNKVKIDAQSYDIVWAEKRAKTGQNSCFGNLPQLILISFGKGSHGYEQFLRIDNLKSLAFKETAGVFTNTSCTMEVAFFAVDANYNTVAMYVSEGQGTVELKADKTFTVTNVKLNSIYSPGNYMTVSASGRYTE